MSMLRATLPVLALLASVTTAQAQTPAQGHEAHHPPATAEQAQSAPAPGRPVGPPMGWGQGMAMMDGCGMSMMGGSGMGMMGGRGMGMSGGCPGGMPMECPMMGQDGDGSGRMRGMPITAGQGGMGMPYRYLEGRIAFLKAEIGITADQADAWDAFADALRRNAAEHRTMHQAMAGAGSVPSTWPERLERHAQAMAARAEALKAVGAASGTLYGMLTAEQRQNADALLSGPMGMPLGPW